MISDERLAKLGLEMRIVGSQLQIKKLLKSGKEPHFEVVQFNTIEAAAAYVDGLSLGLRMASDQARAQNKLIAESLTDLAAWEEVRRACEALGFPIESKPGA